VPEAEETPTYDKLWVSSAIRGLFFQKRQKQSIF